MSSGLDGYPDWVGDHGSCWNFVDNGTLANAIFHEPVLQRSKSVGVLRARLEEVHRLTTSRTGHISRTISRTQEILEETSP